MARTLHNLPQHFNLNRVVLAPSAYTGRAGRKITLYQAQGLLLRSKLRLNGALCCGIFSRLMEMDQT
jgi:hypothetical protein